MVRGVLERSGINYVEVPNEAAFYGPKIDVQVWSAIGREFSIATNQVDFAQPRRFDFVYKDRDTTEKTPLCIHRAPLGTHERFIGIGAIAVSQFVVRPHIQTIIDAREKNLKDYQNEQRAHTKTKTVLKEKEAKLAQTEKNLEDTRTQLAAATTKATEQEKRANGLDQELTKTKQTLSGVQADLAAWSALGIPVEQVKNVIAEVKQLRVANEAIEEEKKILVANLKKADDRLKAILGNDEAPDPPLPAGLRQGDGEREDYQYNRTR